MPISSPLDIAWTHAYWTEGPEFAALALADGAAVSSWPDEAGTDNLAQATAANQPTFVNPASSGGLVVGTMTLTAPVGGGDPNFNNKPVVRFDASNDYMRVDWANLTQPNEIVVVARFRSAGGVGGYLFDGISSTQRHLFYYSAPASDTFNFGTGGAAHLSWAGTNETSLALWRFVINGASSEAFRDEVSVKTGNAGAQVWGGLQLGGRWDLHTDWFIDFDIAFLGVKNGALTATERSDFQAWAQSYYGTP